MTAPSSSSLEIDYYLERVGAALADLPPDVRDDLMEDLPAHFAEVLEERGGSLVERLGPPAAYAAELRAAAGLDAATRPRLGRAAPELFAARLRVLDQRAGRLIGYGRATDFLRLLRPAWWIARGVGLVTLIFAFDIIPTDRFNGPIGWVLIAIAVVVSVRVGATGRPHLPRWAGRGVIAVAAIGLLIVMVNAGRIFDSRDYSPSPAVYSPYSSVTDVYPVDMNGRPIEGVALLDQNGNPIVLGDPWRCATNDQPPPEPPTYPMCVRPRPEPTASPSASASASPSASPSDSLPASPSASSSG
ncbi:hypothetical protein ABT297_16350 [Dactylosporangium sp. NPDC000555]|uniref:HAAS signaling domain-containing protein n=1 Tax=Dactylosporangium sp. NPDC000555 TaxID=3154260 RepID=UPI0033282E5A